MPMTLTLAGSAALLDVLRPAAVSHGCEDVQLLPRAHGQSLRTLLAAARGEILAVEGSEAADLAELEQFTGTHPAVAVVLLARRGDPEHLLAAMRAGVREVLQAPPTAGEFTAALARIENRASGRRRGRVVAFVSCKGGSGATFLAANLAHQLATDHRQRTILLDLDLQYGDAAAFVADTAGAGSNIAAVAAESMRLDASLLEASSTEIVPGFWLLPAPDEPEAALSVTPAGIERVVEVAAENFDFVILDVGRLLDAAAVRALDKAESIHLVTEALVPHVRDARRLVRILRSLGVPQSRLRLVVNRRGRDAELGIEQVEKATGLALALAVPDDFEAVAEAVNAGVPLAQLHPRSGVVRSLRELAVQLAGPPAEDPRGWLGRLMHA